MEIAFLMIACNFHRWIESRRQDDNAEGLWRVHDKLYDLTEFIRLHPGGSDWIQLTKVLYSHFATNQMQNKCVS